MWFKAHLPTALGFLVVTAACAAPVATLPSGVTVPSGAIALDSHQGGTKTALLDLRSASMGYGVQNVVHIWTAADIYQYDVSLKVQSGNSFVDLSPPVSLVAPVNDPNATPATEVVFDNLSQGNVYEADVTAFGDVGASDANVQISNTATALLDFSASQDVQDAIATSVTVTLDPVNFNGTGGVQLTPPSNGTFANPIAPPSIDPPSFSLQGVVTTIAGGTAGYVDALGSAAKFSDTYAIAPDSHGNLFVADYDNNAVREVTPGGLVSTLNRTNNMLPVGLAVDSSNDVYVGSEGGRIFKITPTGAISIVFSGLVNEISGLAIDHSGHLIVVYEAGAIEKLDLTSDTMSLIAGSLGPPGYLDGTGSAARFDLPSGTPVIDSAGNIFVADEGNACIREISPSGVVTTFAGSPGNVGYVDATGAAAKFADVFSMAIDSSDDLYVCDKGNHRVREVTPGGVVTTIAGNGTQAYVDGTKSGASFSQPFGLAVSGEAMYVSDDGRIRVIR